MQVYLITNLVNGKKYIGATKQSLRMRLTAHFNEKQRNSLIRIDSLKYGRNNFKIESLHKCSSKEEMDALEKAAVERENCYAPNGYNVRRWGQSIGGMPLESRKKMSESHKLRFKKNPELRKKMGEYSKMATPYWRGKMAHNRRKIMCIETGKEYPSLKDAAEELKLNISNLCSALRGQLKSTGGLHFKYI